MIESVEEFLQLRESQNPNEYQRAAQEEAPLQVWIEVITRHPEMRVWVAHNKTVPLEILDILSRDADAEVRCLVAMKRKLPESLQKALAKDEDASVRQRIVYNAKATRAALEILTDDEEEAIQEKAKERLASGDHA